MMYLEEKIRDYDEFFNSLKSNEKFERLGKLFRTRENGYIYDLGTGKIFQLDEVEYKILEYIFNNEKLNMLSDLKMEKSDLLNKLEVLRDVIEKENLMEAPPLIEFGSLHEEFDSMKYQIENNLEQITLELTQKCNLRCKYCIYGEENESHRDFSFEDITWETAKAAIDYSMKHSDEKLAITFYGGEPLIKFDLLKQCVEYAKSTKGNKQISYSMTTNLVLMTKEIAEYLASIDMFSVLCSLDGPKEIHDENRLTIDGKGSFDKAVQGLKYLVEAYKDRASTHLSLSMVMTLPSTPKKLNTIQEFFDSLEWLPNDVVKNISYVSSTNHRDERLLRKSKNASTSIISEYINPIADWVNDSIIFNNNMDSEKIFTESFTQSSYLGIHKRMIVDEPVGHYNLNGCCIPASRRLYISTQGDFSLCEKIGTAPLIGNVKDGIDLDSVKKHYIDDYIEDAKRFCSDCWAIRLCGVCYVDCYEEDRFNTEYKRDKCEAELFRAERALIDYHEVLERYPEKLRYLNDVIMS